ncbi:MAG: HD domain-containing protein [Deltaproteobacteria bacterium]|nr:HD domain-containing protein [Deltaproteobacteria bacterium]
MTKEKVERRKNSIVKKFTSVFAVLYIIPMLVSLYILFTLLDLTGKTLQIALLFFFCLLLGMAGHLILRAIVKSLVKTVENVEAVASGDLSRRAGPDSHDELHDFAKNFNKITENLQKTIENLKKSKNQIQTLLSHISKAVASPLEIEKLLGVYLSSITSIIGYKKGIVTLIMGSGEFEILSSVGLSDDERASFLEQSEDLHRRVIDSGTPLTVCDGPGDEEGGDALKKLKGDTESSVSIPLIKSHKVIGVVTLVAGKGTGEGEEDEENAPASRKVGGDDIVMLQNLAAQMATAIENSQLRGDMEKIYFESISALAAAVEARDIYTNGHSRRVSNFSVAIAKLMGLPDDVVKLVHDASLLHDIGKIGIPDTILHNSSAKLPDELYEVIKTHSVIGENIVKPLHSLRTLCPGVRHHHERVDGNGYPDGLAGKAIPIEARIMAVADAYDAMTSDRPYRNMMSQSMAIKQLKKNSGTQFDPQCVSAMLRHLGKKPPVLTREMLKEGEFIG